MKVPATTDPSRLGSIDDFGAILRRTASGTNWVWQRVHSGTEENLVSTDSDGGGALWVVGTKGTVLRSTDKGATWVKCLCFNADGSRVKEDLDQVRFTDGQGCIVSRRKVFLCNVP